MKLNTIMLFVLFFIFNGAVNGQSNPITDGEKSIEKAAYLKEDLTHFLLGGVKYPKAAQEKGIQGDVVFSFVISSKGELDKLKVDSSPDDLLAASAMDMMEKVFIDAWSPAKINHQPIDKKYTVIFRYRTYLNMQPVDYKKKAEESFAKQKYKVALKLYNNALEDNPFDQALFESRSKVKEAMGDVEGADADHLVALELQDEVMSVLNITSFGVTRVSSSRPIGTARQHENQGF